jgi:hypothetical protein
MSEVRAAMPRSASRRAIARAARATATVALLSAIAAAPAVADESWGFEQVTPVVKGGAAVANLDTFQTDERGDTLLYTAASPFESVPAESAPRYTRYLGTRGPSGWSSRGVDPPYSPKSYFNIQAVLATSVNLEYALVISNQALTAGAIEGGSNLYMRVTRTGALTLVAAHEDPLFTSAAVGLQGELMFKYVAPDGRAAIFQANVPLTPGSPASTYESVLYSWTAEEGVKAASVLPDSEGGATIANVASTPTSEVGARDSAPHTDGMAHIYFADYSRGVYMRTGDETRAISVSRIPGAPSTPVPGDLDAVGNGGRHALFHTFGERLTEDTPEDPLHDNRFLYRYNVADDSLTYIGADTSDGGQRGVEAAIQMTQDGQTIVFQSLLSLEGQGVAGKQNIYIWRHGRLTFVETADRTASDPETGQGPSTAAGSGNFLRLLSPDGRYFAFIDNSPSVAQRVGYDNSQTSVACKQLFYDAPDTCDQVFLFDADADELTCVSCPSDGTRSLGKSGDPSGHNAAKLRLNAYQPRIVTDDGTVFFGTPNPLLTEDNNGLDDVYAFRDGKLRLISRARPGHASRFLDATADAKTVFISTGDPITPTDTDTAVDIYMTRLGAGFPFSPVPVRRPCSGDDCRPAAPAPIAPPVLASVSFAGDETAPVERRSGMSVAAPKAARGSVAAVRVRVPGPGTIRVSGSGLTTAKRSATDAATYTVKVSLTAKAKRTLRSKRSVKVKTRVAYTPRGERQVVKTVVLTFTRSNTGAR